MKKILLLNMRLHVGDFQTPKIRILQDLFFKIFIGVYLIYNVVLVSGVQQTESIIHIHISTLFQILFPYRPLQSIEQSSLCYKVCPYYLSILYIVVYHIFLIHSSVYGHLGCSHILTIVYDATMNTGLHISLQMTVFVFFG